MSIRPRFAKIALTSAAIILVPVVLALALGSRVLIGDMVVVGKEIERESSTNLIQACVRYRAYGDVERTCVPGATTGTGTSLTDSSALLKCFNEARVGSPLPESCRQ